MHRVACVSRALAGRRGPYKKFTETTGRFLSASFFFLYHVLVLRVRDYPRIFQRRGRDRREKGERSRTKSISNLKINANARAKLEVKGVENRTGILHGSFANAFTFSRNTFELATQTAFCGLWSIALKLALIPFGCRAAFSTRRRWFH